MSIKRRVQCLHDAQMNGQRINAKCPTYGRYTLKRYE